MNEAFQAKTEADTQALAHKTEASEAQGEAETGAQVESCSRLFSQQLKVAVPHKVAVSHDLNKSKLMSHLKCTNSNSLSKK